MSMGVFFTRSVSDTIFAILFFPLKIAWRPPGKPQFEKHCYIVCELLKEHC
jgi:hypothetical protein